MYENNLGAIARTGLEAGATGLARFQLRVMSPIAPMLAQTADGVDEALTTIPGDIAFEWKMDGARIQVHKQGDLVRIFTRGLNEVTDTIPEIADAARGLPADQLVLDGEAIAFAAAAPSPFKPRCVVLAASWMSSACGRNCPFALLLRLPAAGRGQPGGAPGTRTLRGALGHRAAGAADSAPGHALRAKPRLRSTTRRWPRDTKA